MERTKRLDQGLVTIIRRHSYENNSWTEESERRGGVKKLFREKSPPEYRTSTTKMETRGREGYERE